MDAFPSVIPKSICEVINSLENDRDNRFSWKLMRSLDSLSLTVSLKLRAKTSHKAKDDSEVTGHVTVNPVVRRRKKKSPSALARSKQRLRRFLEKKSAGKPDLAVPEIEGIAAVPCEQDSVDSSSRECAEELENTSLSAGNALALSCGSNRSTVSSENQTSVKNSTSGADLQPDLAQEQELLQELLRTTADLDSDDDMCNISVCANCKCQPKKGKDLKRCARCHITQYCSVECQRKDWDFHRFACSVVAKKPDNQPVCVGCLQVINNSGQRIQSDCVRTFFSLPKPKLPDLLLGSQGSKNKEYSERRLLGYSKEQMFDIVAQVDKYKEFVPWCTQSTIFNQRPGFLNCKLAVGFAPLLEEKYNSAVTLHRPNMVKSECMDGILFNHLLTIWKFSSGIPGNPNSCTLDFSVKFEFRSQLHSQVSSLFFDQVVKTMVTAFLKRAEKIHGPSSIKPQKPLILSMQS